MKEIDRDASVLHTDLGLVRIGVNHLTNVYFKGPLLEVTGRSYKECEHICVMILKEAVIAGTSEPD